MKLIFNFKNLLLLLVLLFLLFFTLGVDVFAVQTGTQSDFGYYVWYQGTDTLINGFNTFIADNKADYDSFIICSKEHTYCLFYNFADTGYCRTQRDGWSSNYNFIFENGNPTNFKYYQIDLTSPLELSTITNFIQDMSAYKVYTNRSLYTGNFNTLWLQSTDESINIPVFNFTINLSTINNTYEPIYALTDWFNISYAHTYYCYISTDSTNWSLMHYETLTDNGSTYFRFSYPILNNGTYYFKFFNSDTEETLYYSLQVTNILNNSSNSGTNSLGIPQPFLDYKKGSEYFTIFTQYFNRDNISRYQCFYTTDTNNNDFTSWSLATIGSIYNDLTSSTDYYFYTTIPLNSNDLTLKFVFYDTLLGDYGFPTSITCNIEGMTSYGDTITTLLDDSNTVFGRLKAKYFQKLGFLTFPLDFVQRFFDRLLRLDYGEPIIVVPELKEPFNNTTIYEGFTYNFNSLLENETFAYIHNIYYIVVDGVLIFAFINMLFKFGMNELWNI